MSQCFFLARLNIADVNEQAWQEAGNRSRTKSGLVHHNLWRWTRRPINGDARSETVAARPDDGPRAFHVIRMQDVVLPVRQHKIRLERAEQAQQVLLAIDVDHQWTVTPIQTIERRTQGLCGGGHFAAADPLDLVDRRRRLLRPERRRLALLAVAHVMDVYRTASINKPGNGTAGT